MDENRAIAQLVEHWPGWPKYLCFDSPYCCSTTDNLPSYWQDIDLQDKCSAVERASPTRNQSFTILLPYESDAHAVMNADEVETVTSHP